MTVTTMSSREFNQDTSRAKKAACVGPVFITDRGQPAHVLLSIEQYRTLTATKLSLADAIAQNRPDADFDFVPPKLDSLIRPADFE